MLRVFSDDASSLEDNWVFGDLFFCYVDTNH